MFHSRALASAACYRLACGGGRPLRRSAPLPGTKRGRPSSDTSARSRTNGGKRWIEVGSSTNASIVKTKPNVALRLLLPSKLNILGAGMQRRTWLASKSCARSSIGCRSILYVGRERIPCEPPRFLLPPFGAKRVRFPVLPSRLKSAMGRGVKCASTINPSDGASEGTKIILSRRDALNSERPSLLHMIFH